MNKENLENNLEAVSFVSNEHKTEQTRIKEWLTEIMKDNNDRSKTD